MSTTAKIRLTTKQDGTGGEGTSMLTFGPDYQDDRNKEWAAATPHLHLQMTVKGAALDQFEVGKAYTLTFDSED